MRINSVNQSNAIAQYMNAVQAKQDKTPARPELQSDSVELSEGAKKYAAFLKQVRANLESSEVEEAAKVDEIMEKIKNNEYNVSSDDVARSIMRGIPTHI
ncbi:MAG: flagellar biosynthesis anti-sigma factor FlgM [Clostridiales bacterium]|nr:flagellar biosynthesis anti-sigma factor FlgM [Clostridiales bacterium]